MLIFLFCLPFFTLSFLFFTEYISLLNNDYNPLFDKFKNIYFHIIKTRNSNNMKIYI